MVSPLLGAHLTLERTYSFHPLLYPAIFMGVFSRASTSHPLRLVSQQGTLACFLNHQSLWGPDDSNDNRGKNRGSVAISDVHIPVGRPNIAQFHLSCLNLIKSVKATSRNIYAREPLFARSRLAWAVNLRADVFAANHFIQYQLMCNATSFPILAVARKLPWAVHRISCDSKTQGRKGMRAILPVRSDVPASRVVRANHQAIVASSAALDLRVHWVRICCWLFCFLLSQGDW